MVSNNVGNKNIWKYEDFTEDSSGYIFASLELSISVGCSGRLVPKFYKKIEYNYDESIPVSKFPTCAWASDAFINWISENSVNLTTSLLGSVITTAVSGGVTAISTAGSVLDIIGKFRKADLLPSIEGGQATGDINFSSTNNNIEIHHMRAKLEYLQCIDNFFTRFGYKVNSLKMPNITGRTYWNYVEIANSEEIGNGEVPSIFMEDINNACRKGTTIWHNHENIGNYNLTNSMI